MKYSITGESLPVAVCQLQPGECMISEAGGRTWSRGNVESDVTGQGGAKGVLGRAFSGESLFLSKYTARGVAEIAFASSFPGSILPIELSAGQSIVCQKRAFLAATEGVGLSVFFQKSIGRGLFGGEGFIMQRVTGPGLVFIEIDGSCTKYDLAPGERITCDTGVVAMMDESCTMEVEMVKSLKNMVFGGEGVFDTVVTGPGRVWLQSMTVAKLASLIVPYVPSK